MELFKEVLWKFLTSSNTLRVYLHYAMDLSVIELLYIILTGEIPTSTLDH